MYSGVALWNVYYGSFSKYVYKINLLSIYSQLIDAGVKEQTFNYRKMLALLHKRTLPSVIACFLPDSFVYQQTCISGESPKHSYDGWL